MALLLAVLQPSVTDRYWQQSLIKQGNRRFKRVSASNHSTPIIQPETRRCYIYICYSGALLYLSIYIYVCLWHATATVIQHRTAESGCSVSLTCPCSSQSAPPPKRAPPESSEASSASAVVTNGCLHTGATVQGIYIR